MTKGNIEMEMNKDESEKCLSFALKYFEHGDRTSALKFVRKSLKLYPLDKAKELLIRLESPRTEKDGSAASGPSHKPKSPAESGATHNTARKHEAKVKDYTEEQLVAVNKILKCRKNYYEVLSVSKDCTENDVSKAYKKLALKIHPDKNQAPGADEAFKAIGEAYAILSNPEKKKHYDVYGNDDELQTQRNHHNQGYSQYEYESELTPEEVFNMFFSNVFSSPNMHPRHSRTRRHAPQRHENAQHARSRTEQQSSYTVLLQLAPILILIVLSALSSLLVSDPVFSLQQTHKYPVSRKTANLGIQYFVRKEFSKEYTGNVRQLEAQVEEEFLNSLRNACYRERQYKEQMLYSARLYQNQRMFDNANSLGTPSCDRLQEIYS